jgi:hypothetical protein
MKFCSAFESRSCQRLVHIFIWMLLYVRCSWLPFYCWQ